MKSSIFTITLILFMLVFSAASQKKLDLGAINSHLKKMCLSNPDNYIKDPNVVKCKITYDVACWKDTPAGQTVVQPCPFLLFSTKDNISRRCDEQGEWQKMNITNCRRLTPKVAVEKGKQISNITVTNATDDSLTHSERVKRVNVICSWVAFVILLPTFIVICIVIRHNDRFTLHKNLILAFILRILTLFIYYYGKMGEKESNKTVCNVFWLLNRYFAASEITWMLNEGIFLMRTLVYPFDNESYLWYYSLFGWGFSGVLTFCVYLPYVQFKIARVSESCWVNHSHTHHMLVLYVPLTIMFVINFGIAAYVVRMLAKKLKNSQSSHMNTIKKGAKAVVILISLLGLIYLLTFYQPENSPGYNYFVAVVYPLQGIMVCIFCVYLSMEFRESFRRYWMKWRYGILIDTNPYSATHDIEPGPSGERGTSASVLVAESSEELQPRARSIASLRDASRPPSAQTISKQFPAELTKNNSQRSLLSRSSDLTKYRLKKVEPEPLKPVRVQSAGPEVWCPPTLPAVTAWQEIELSENRHEPNLNQGLDNKGFSAKSEGDISHLGSQNSLQHKTSSQAELDTNESEDPSNTTPEEARESFSSQTSLEHKTLSQVELETNDFGDPSNSTPEEIRESLTSNSNKEFSFSSQSFEHDTWPSTADTELTASGGQILTTTAGPSISQDAQPSTSTENSNVFSRGKQFWNKAQKLASERRRSRLEQNRVVSTEGDSLHLHQKYADKQKDADEYRLAWIAKILRGNNSHENESDA